MLDDDDVAAHPGVPGIALQVDHARFGELLGNALALEGHCKVENGDPAVQFPVNIVQEVVAVPDFQRRSQGNGLHMRDVIALHLIQNGRRGSHFLAGLDPFDDYHHVLHSTVRTKKEIHGRFGAVTADFGVLGDRPGLQFWFGSRESHDAGDGSAVCDIDAIVRGLGDGGRRNWLRCFRGLFSLARTTTGSCQ